MPAPAPSPHHAVHLRTVVPAGSPWIFRKMVRDAEPRTEPGSVVRVLDRDGGFVCQAFWNPQSELSLRVLTRDETPIDDEWFRRMVRRAITLRRDVLQLDKVANAWRAVFSEGDGIPGLVVDRFADVLSCQVSTLGAYRAFPVIVEELKRLLEPRVVHVAADPKIAKLEGFPFPASAGEAARVVVREHGLEFEVDCAGGHKTGFFLDQRESRLRVRELARGRRVLDLCSYTGGFAINAAKGDAASVTGVDLDEVAVAHAKRNAERNKLTAKLKFVHADAFDYVRGLQGPAPELVIVDPAKQATKKEDVPHALKHYHDLNALVFERCAKDAIVLSCSCTGLVSEHAFLGALADAAIAARRVVTFLDVRGAPADHPVPSDFPQARYLKVVLVRVS